MTIRHNETCTAIADIPECMIYGFKVISLYARNVQLGNNQIATWIDGHGHAGTWKSMVEFHCGVLLVFDEASIQ